MKAILNPGWELDERELKTLPCSFIYWLDQNSIDPTKFLKTIFGPTNEAYEPEVVIGSIDKGSLAAYLDRCVRESAQERYCKICSPHVGKNKRGSALLQTKLAGSIPAFAILEQTVADNYHGLFAFDLQTPCARPTMPGIRHYSALAQTTSFKSGLDGFPTAM